MFQTVVVGAADSPTATRAFDAAVDLVARSGGTLHVVSAYKPVTRSSAAVPAEFRDAVQPDSRVRSVLEDLAARARSQGVTVQSHDQRGDPAQAVQDVAERVSADLVGDEPPDPVQHPQHDRPPGRVRRPHRQDGLIRLEPSSHRPPDPRPPTPSAEH